MNLLIAALIAAGIFSFAGDKSVNLEEREAQVANATVNMWDLEAVEKGLDTRHARVHIASEFSGHPEVKELPVLWARDRKAPVRKVESYGPPSLNVVAYSAGRGEATPAADRDYRDYALRDGSRPEAPVVLANSATGSVGGILNYSNNSLLADNGKEIIYVPWTSEKTGACPQTGSCFLSIHNYIEVNMKKFTALTFALVASFGFMVAVASQAQAESQSALQGLATSTMIEINQ
jgi:hypothetical protein